MAVEHSKKYNKQKKTCLDQNQFLTWHSSQQPLGHPSPYSEPNLDTGHFQPGLDWPGRRKSKGSIDNFNLTSCPWFWHHGGLWTGGDPMACLCHWVTYCLYLFIDTHFYVPNVMWHILCSSSDTKIHPWLLYWGEKWGHV